MYQSGAVRNVTVEVAMFTVADGAQMEAKGKNRNVTGGGGCRDAVKCRLM
jgi:hypothetical protein